jgi:hypothetical protein
MMTRLVKAARAVYEEDDAWTVDRTPKQLTTRRARDTELGAALAALPGLLYRATPIPSTLKWPR